jgi:hypothetical protein
MKRNEVVVGNVYRAKVSGKKVPIRILRDRGTDSKFEKCSAGIRYVASDKHDGWDAVNINTGRKIHIGTAARLTKLHPIDEATYNAKDEEK